MKILISCAGVAGLSFAFWAKRYGFNPVIVEKAPALRTGGYKIDVRGVALEVTRKMGLQGQVKELETEILGASIVDRLGKTIPEMSGDEFGLRGGEDIELMRGDLCHSPYAYAGRCKPAALSSERGSLVGHGYNHDLLATASLPLSHESSLGFPSGHHLRKVS
jgi:hypothetical protein